VRHRRCDDQRQGLPGRRNEHGREQHQADDDTSDSHRRHPIQFGVEHAIPARMHDRRDEHETDGDWVDGGSRVRAGAIQPRQIVFP
jgi:hypothetical protein